MTKVALFDLDHTLIPMDSDFQWGEFTLALGWCDSTEFKLRNTEFYEHYKAGTLDIHAYVRFATLAMRQQGAAKSAEAHAAFMQTVVQAAIRPQARLGRRDARIDGTVFAALEQRLPLRGDQEIKQQLPSRRARRPGQ